MKYPKKYKIHKLAGNRYGQTGVRLEGSQLIATNGYAMAIVKVTETNMDAQRVLPVDAFKSAAVGRGDIAQIYVADGGATVCHEQKPAQTFALQDADEDKSFPSWEQVIPKGSDPALTIRLSAEQLLNLIASLGGKNAKIDFQFRTDDKGAIGSQAVTMTVDDGESFGVLMPIAQV